jgi:2-keto-4-pentenoate hydratase/2-oxohepta-3-ene-1,7-dioic acid hydratase in catechol pathway
MLCETTVEEQRMKLVTYLRDGRIGYGAMAEGGIVDLSKRIGDQFPDVRSLFGPGGLDVARKALDGRPADFALDGVRLLPPILNPGKILCIGLNYEDHRKETKRDKTEAPAVFVRFAESQVGHDQAMLCPRESVKFDYEGEIAVIVGKAGRRISEENAWDHVGGYSCYNDGSVRDWQLATSQWTPGKNFPATGGFGPWIVTTDELPARTVLTLVTRLNGTELQRATTDQLIHSIPRLIAHLSTWVPLSPGDVIVSGTPGGVGARREPPIWMKAGDVVEVEVSGVGVLKNRIENDS